MSKKQPSNHTNSRDQKRNLFAAGARNSSRKTGGFVAAAVVAAMVLAILYVIFAGRGAGETGDTANVITTGQDVAVSMADVNDGKARFYEYELSGGKKIGFFVIKSSDGVVRAAFNACDVCFKSKRGYHQEGDDMVCNNCGRHFPSASVNVITGGCNPVPLVRQISGDQVVIKASDLARGETYF
ncbi:MAG TPA: DUF2318 domain-containing protein [Blastocatellia bacterium]|nr:DUF2318 domain-containing protein [Blastocatellia bacterium]